MFLFTDSQVVDESMLVYINDLLSSGEIPDLFAQEDKDEIINSMRGWRARSHHALRTNCWNVFIQRVKNNLHMLFSWGELPRPLPAVHSSLRLHLLPSLIGSVQPWPEASLFSMAKKRFHKKRFHTCMEPTR